jgi:hypothetical protein
MVSHHGQAACDVIVCWRSARAARAHTKCGPPLGSPLCEKSQCNHDAIMITAVSITGTQPVMRSWAGSRHALGLHMRRSGRPSAAPSVYLEVIMMQS